MKPIKLLSDQVTADEIAIITRELQRVLDRRVKGDVVEFGCYVGTTSVFLAAALQSTRRQLYLYDSFAGLPEKTQADYSPAGEQFQAGKLMASKKQLIKHFRQAGVPLPRITKAWFNELTPQDVPRQVAFAFLDGDYYQSVKGPLQLLTPVLSPGAVIVVDDYANEALPGASLAVDEWLQQHSARLQVEQSLAIIHY